MPRAQATIAAAAAGDWISEGEVLALVAAGIVGDTTYRARRRKKAMLSARVREVFGTKKSPREQMRKNAVEWGDGFAYNAEQRRKMAKSGAAMPDGSFAIANCADAERAIRAQGRAKNQDAAVRHIRKRVRALSCSGDIFDNYR